MIPSRGNFSLLAAGSSFAAVLSRLAGGKLADRIGEERVIPYGLSLSGLGLALLIFLGGIPTLILCGLLSGCGHGFLFPCLNSLIIRGESVDIRGKITGIFTGALDAGAFVGSITLGFVGNWAGYGVLFLVAASALFGGLLIRIPSSRERKR